MVEGALDGEIEQNHLGRLKIYAGAREYTARVAIEGAKKPETRARRIEGAIRMIAARPGRKRK